MVEMMDSGTCTLGELDDVVVLVHLVGGVVLLDDTIDDDFVAGREILLGFRIDAIEALAGIDLEGIVVEPIGQAAILRAVAIDLADHTLDIDAVGEVGCRIVDEGDGLSRGVGCLDGVGDGTNVLDGDDCGSDLALGVLAVDSHSLDGSGLAYDEGLGVGCAAIVRIGAIEGVVDLAAFGSRDGDGLWLGVGARSRRDDGSSHLIDGSAAIGKHEGDGLQTNLIVGLGESNGVGRGANGNILECEGVGLGHCGTIDHDAGSLGLGVPLLEEDRGADDLRLGSYHDVEALGNGAIVDGIAFRLAVGLGEINGGIVEVNGVLGVRLCPIGYAIEVPADKVEGYGAVGLCSESCQGNCS